MLHERIRIGMYTMVSILTLIVCVDYLNLCFDFYKQIDQPVLSTAAYNLSFTYGLYVRLAIPVFYMVFFLAEFREFRWNNVIDNAIKKTICVAGAIVFYTAFVILPEVREEGLVLSYPLSFLLMVICQAGIALFLTAYVSKPEEGEGIVNDQEPIEKDYGFVLTGKDGYVNVPNPFRGIFVLGGPGSGKSASIAEPLLYQAVEKGYTGLVYDYDYPALADKLYTSALLHQRTDTRIYVINLNDLNQSHRVNPIKPEYLKNVNYADEFTNALFNNLNPKAAKETSDFWIMSAKQVIKATMWFLREEYPQYCTIPHLVRLLMQSDDQIIRLLQTNSRTREMISSLAQAHEKGAEKQSAGIMGQVQTYLDKINTKEIAWVLSGDDFDLDLNNPDDKKLLVLGNTAGMEEAYAPVMSLIATVSIKHMNQQDKAPSFVMIDEAPTIFIPKLDNLPATGRKNKVATMVMLQDASQLEFKYGEKKFRSLMGTLSNQFYGNVNEPGFAEKASKIFGTQMKAIENQSQTRSYSRGSGSRSQTLNYNLQEKKRLKPEEIQSLEQGRFVGKTVGAHHPTFDNRLHLLEEYSGTATHYPIEDFAHNVELEKNYVNILHEVKQILEEFE